MTMIILDCLPKTAFRAPLQSIDTFFLFCHRLNIKQKSFDATTTKTRENRHLEKQCKVKKDLFVMKCDLAC